VTRKKQRRKTRRNGTVKEALKEVNTRNGTVTNSKASTILRRSRETVFSQWDSNVQEYPFAKWNSDKFAWKANLHGRPLFSGMGNWLFF
jgi:hypothetical protein